MALTYGFYNAKNHDRRYNAIQMSSIFDGIIEDGVFMTIGSRFQVSRNSGMVVNVGTGRAWFDHTWTLNDTLLPLTVPQSEVVLSRIDAVVLEVNADQSVRANSIKIVRGTPATSPSRPTLTKTENVHQYALAYISVSPRVTEIYDADITMMVGKGETPYVTGPLQTIDIEGMVAQWESQWKVFFDAETADMKETNAFWKEQWEAFYKSQTSQIQAGYLKWDSELKEYFKNMTDTADSWKEMWQKWFYDYINNSSAELAYWKQLIENEFVEYTTFWKNEWNQWYNAQTNQIRQSYINWNTSLKTFYDEYTRGMNQTADSWKEMWQKWFYDYINNSSAELAYWKKLLEKDSEDWSAVYKDMINTSDSWKEMWQKWFYDYINNSSAELAYWKKLLEEDFVKWWESVKDIVEEPSVETAIRIQDLENRVSALESILSKNATDK